MQPVGEGQRTRVRGSAMPDGIRFASAGDDIKIWDSSSMTVVEQFNPHSASHPVSSLCWSSNNHFLVTASSSGDKIVVSSCKSKPVPLLDLAEDKQQTCVNLNSNSQYVVTGGLDSTVNIWDLKSKRLHRSLKDHRDEVTCVTFNGNDCYVASGSLSGEIILHNVTTNLSCTPFGHGSSQPVRHLKYSYVKKFLLGTVSDSGAVSLWDTNTQSTYHMFESAHKAPASGICFSPVNDLLLVTIGLDKRIICYDVSSKIILQTVVAESPLTAVDFMPDGATLAVGSSRGKIYLYDLRMLSSPTKTVNAHKTSVQCIQFQNGNAYKSSKGSSSKLFLSSSAVNKKPVAKSGAIFGGSHNANLIKDLPPAVAVPQPAVDNKGMEEKSGIPHSTSLDVIPSKETDYNKTTEVKSMDTFGRSSLGDIFSPVRDDALYLKGSEDLVSKGNDLDYLAQLNSVSSRRNTVGAHSQGIHSSPLHLIIGSPIKEEDENFEPDVKTAKPYISKPDLRENARQSSKIQNADVISITTSPAPVSRTHEVTERSEKYSLSQFRQDFPSNSSRVASPYKVPTSISTEVASSLSEKIADSIASDRSGAPLTSVQINFIRNMIEETLDDFREACHRDIVNLQVEMIKQFHIQSSEIHMLLERYSVNESLVSEIEKLREENKKLRANF